LTTEAVGYHPAGVPTGGQARGDRTGRARRGGARAETVLAGRRGRAGLARLVLRGGRARHGVPRAGAAAPAVPGPRHGAVVGRAPRPGVVGLAERLGAAGGERGDHAAGLLRVRGNPRRERAADFSAYGLGQLVVQAGRVSVGPVGRLVLGHPPHRGPGGGGRRRRRGRRPRRDRGGGGGGG